MALDRWNCQCRQVVETTVELTQKAGVPEIVGRIINNLKDEKPSHTRRWLRMTKVTAMLGALDIDKRYAW
jgi:splicing factor 3B subunit 1